MHCESFAVLFDICGAIWWISGPSTGNDIRFAILGDQHVSGLGGLGILAFTEEEALCVHDQDVEPSLLVMAVHWDYVVSREIEVDDL